MSEKIMESILEATILLINLCCWITIIAIAIDMARECFR